jgi:uridine phosphorylase
MSEHHIQCEREDIAPAVMLVGDPGRATRAAALLEESRLVNDYRELLVYTGLYGGTRLTVATTAMGAPSAAIVLEELCNLGSTVFVRVGSAGGLAPGLVSGDIVVATAAVREDGTSACYLRPTFPAIGDPELVAIVRASAERVRARSVAGVVVSHDAFYRGFAMEELTRLRDAGALAQEMETGCIYIVAQVRRVRAAALFAIGGNLLLSGKQSRVAFDKGEEEAVRIGLDALAEAVRVGLVAGG